MKFLNRILELNWLGNSEEEKISFDNSDISAGKFTDDGGIYLLCLDWDSDKIEEFVHSHFLPQWEKQMDNTEIVICRGAIDKDSKGGNIQVFETSLGEVFNHEEQ